MTPPTPHHHRFRIRRGDQLRRRRGVHTHEDAALTARRHGHVAADQEGEASEHLLLGEALLPGDELADPVGEILVVRHRTTTLSSGALEPTANGRTPGSGSKP